MKEKFVKRLMIPVMACMLAVSAPAASALPFMGTTAITAEAATKKVALNKKSGSLAVGGKTTIQLKNINTKKAISWTSSNKKVATVKKGSSGKATVTAKKAGKATITAKYAGKKYTFKVTVKSPVLSKKSITLTAGKKYTVQLKNIVSSKKITWVSKKKSIATVKKGSNGKATITAKKKGKVYIYAKYNGKNYRVTVNVKAPAPKLNKSSATLSIKGKTTLSLSNAVKGKKTTWKSSKSSVVSVKKNSTNKVTLTAKKAGKATIYATHNGKKYKCTVTVKAPSLNRSSLSLVAGKSGTLTVNNRVSGKTVKASTSNSKVATVGVSGSKVTVKGIGAGTATIKVAHNGKTFSCKVTVTKPAPAPAPSKPSTSTPNTTVPKPTPSNPSTGTNTGNTGNVTKPSTPQTEKPETPVTEAPKPSIPETNPPQTEKPEKPETPETNPPQTEKPETPETNPPQTEAPETEAPKPVIWLPDYQPSEITVAGGERTEITFNTSISNKNSISYSVSNSNIEVLGDDLNFNVIEIAGRKPGTSVVTVSGGGQSVSVKVTVTSLDTEWAAYDQWISNLLGSLGCSNSDPVESFKKLGAWLVDNRDYDASNPSYMKLPTMGGSCDAFTSLFIDVAERYFGLEADANIVSSGHINAVVVINGEKWFFDAGSDGKAGYREFNIVPQNPNIPVMVYIGGVWSEYK